MSSTVCAVHHYGCTLYHTCLLTHPSSFLFRNQPTQSTMSSTKSSSTTLSVSDIPRFNGRNFQGWSEKMMGVFMMAKVYSVITGNTSKPNEDTHPSAPSKPIVINNQTPAVNIPKLQAMWMQYQVEMMGYSHLVSEYNRKLSSWTDANSQAMGILNQALDIGIWDQIKDKTANGTAAIHGHSTFFVKTWVDSTKPQTVTISHLSLVFYMPGIGICLLSMGLLLKGNMRIKGDEHTLEFIQAQTGKVKIVALTRLFTDTIYWVNSEVLTGSELTAHKSMHRDNYDLWHR